MNAHAQLHAFTDSEVESSDGNGVIDDYSDDATTAGTATVDAEGVKGSIESSGDQDWFKIELLAGVAYEINLTALDSDFDPLLHGIFNSSGLEIQGTTNDDGGRGQDSRLLFKPSEGGTYFISAGAFGGDMGDYRLSVSRFQPDVEVVQTAELIFVGGSRLGHILFTREIDLYAVELERGRYYQIDVEGSSSKKGTLGDPYLIEIRSDPEQGLPLFGDDNDGAGFNSRSTYRATESGYHYIEVSGAPQGETGTYSISVREITDDYPALSPYEDDRSEFGEVVVGGTAWGVLELGGDTDYFIVEVEAGQSYEITLSGLATTGSSLFAYGSPLDPFYRDEEGNLQLRPTDGDKKLKIRADKDGEVFIAVSGGDYQSVGKYWLSIISTPPPDDDSSVQALSGSSGIHVEPAPRPPGENGRGIFNGPLWHEDPIFMTQDTSFTSWHPSDLDFLRSTWEANSPDVFADWFEKLVTSEELEGASGIQAGDSALAIRGVEQVDTPQGFPFDDPSIESDLSSQTELSWGVPDIDLF